MSSLQTLQRPTTTIATRRARNRWRDKSDESRVDDTHVANFGRLIYERCKDGDLISKLAIAKIVSRVKDGAAVTEREASAWISRVREFMIKEYNETFIYVQGDKAYKIAQGAEKPLQVGKIGHMALKWKYRFWLTSQILNKEEMKMAGAHLIERVKRDLGPNNGGELILASMKNDMKTLRIEAKNAAD